MLNKAIIGFKFVVERGGTQLHTGKCGVYGNDLATICMITILAARRVGLPKIIFYLYDGTGRDIVEKHMNLSSA